MSEVQVFCSPCRENVDRCNLASHLSTTHLNMSYTSSTFYICCGICECRVPADEVQFMMEHCHRTGHKGSEVYTDWGKKIKSETERIRKLILTGIDLLVKEDPSNITPTTFHRKNGRKRKCLDENDSEKNLSGTIFVTPLKPLLKREEDDNEGFPVEEEAIGFGSMHVKDMEEVQLTDNIKHENQKRQPESETENDSAKTIRGNEESCLFFSKQSSSRFSRNTRRIPSARVSNGCEDSSEDEVENSSIEEPIRARKNFSTPFIFKETEENNTESAPTETKLSGIVREEAEENKDDDSRKMKTRSEKKRHERGHGKRSEVWQFFSEVPERGESIYECNLCREQNREKEIREEGRQKKFLTIRTTSHGKQHLRLVHPLIMCGIKGNDGFQSEEESLDQRTISSDEERKNISSKTSEATEKSRETEKGEDNSLTATSAWNYFENVPDKGESMYECLNCREEGIVKILKIKTIAHAKQHLQRVHRLIVVPNNKKKKEITVIMDNVWDYFKKTPEKGECKYECLRCRQEDGQQRILTLKNITHGKNHFHLVHRIIFRRREKKKETSVTVIRDSMVKYFERIPGRGNNEYACLICRKESGQKNLLTLSNIRDGKQHLLLVHHLKFCGPQERQFNLTELSKAKQEALMYFRRTGKSWLAECRRRTIDSQGARKGGRHPIHSFYEERGEGAICKVERSDNMLCDKVIKKAFLGNLSNHIKSVHPDSFARAQEMWNSNNSEEPDEQ